MTKGNEINDLDRFIMTTNATHDRLMILIFMLTMLMM